MSKKKNRSKNRLIKRIEGTSDVKQLEKIRDFISGMKAQKLINGKPDSKMSIWLRGLLFL